jgi:hypothetical protein
MRAGCLRAGDWVFAVGFSNLKGVVSGYLFAMGSIITLTPRDCKMTFVDDVLESYLRGLGRSEVYARAQWAWLNNRGPQPNHLEHGISDKDAQRVRIKLAISNQA